MKRRLYAFIGFYTTARKFAEKLSKTAFVGKENFVKFIDDEGVNTKVETRQLADILEV